MPNLCLKNQKSHPAQEMAFVNTLSSIQFRRPKASATPWPIT